MLAPGTRLDAYEIIAPLGAGGMGEVYRARDSRLQREVALKIIPASLATDADRLRRFENEARAAARLSHPNILHVYDVGQHEGNPYLVTELLKGETLRERLEGGPLSVRRAIEFATAVAQGLAAAHDEGIVHRDLKPENLFLTADGRVKILDFGLAKLTRPDDGGEGTVAAVPTVGADTALGIVLGTVGYMSPEQVRGQAADARSDIFTFGAILYEMVSGKRAFRGETPADTMSAILKEDPPELTLTAKDIPPVLDRIVHRCLEKAPARRFRSAQDLAFSLEAISTASGTAAGAAASGAAGEGAPGAAGRRGDILFRPITYSRGIVFTARFAPDGHTVLYAAAWEGEPLRIFMKRSETPDPIPIPLPAADVLAISPTGEMAIQLSPEFAHAGAHRGTLAVAPLFGGAPRPIAENITSADYNPAGNAMVAVRDAGGKSYIEYPLGTVLYETAGHASFARMSPRGDRIAFLDHPLRVDDRSSVAVLDLQGKKTVLTKEWATVQGLAWGPSGDEVWFTASDSGTFRSNIYGVTLSGQLRQVHALAGGIRLEDISRSGDVLLSRDNIRCGILGKGPGETRERDLTWLDWSLPEAISADGKTLLFEEENESVGRDYAVCIRGMDGSPVIRLGEGNARGLSPDGRWAVARVPYADAPLVLLPTGLGQKREFPTPGLRPGRTCWLSDNRRLIFLGRDERSNLRLMLLDTGDGSLTPLGLERAESAGSLAVSPDDRMVVVGWPDSGDCDIVPLDGSAPRKGPGLRKGDILVAFDSGSEWIYVRSGARQPPMKVDRVHIERGTREPWRELMPADVGGLFSLAGLSLVLDGEAYAYLYVRILSDLYLGQGLV